MEKEIYLATQLAVLQIGRIAYGLDIDGFISQLTEAEKVVPDIQGKFPGTAAQSKANMQAIKDLAESLKPVKASFDKAFKEMTKHPLKVTAEQHRNK